MEKVRLRVAKAEAEKLAGGSMTCFGNNIFQDLALLAIWFHSPIMAFSRGA